MPWLTMLPAAAASAPPATAPPTAPSAAVRPVAPNVETDSADPATVMLVDPVTPNVLPISSGPTIAVTATAMATSRIFPNTPQPP